MREGGREPVVGSVEQDDAVEQRHAEVVQLDERAPPGEAEARRDPERVHLLRGRHAHRGVPHPPRHLGVQRLAPLLAEHLRVAQPQRERTGIGAEGGHAHGDRSGEGAAPDLVAADDERRTRVEELPLDLERGIRDRHQPAGTASGTSPNVSGWSLRIDQRSMGQVMTKARPTTWSIGTKPLVGPSTL
ncbi:hypothetical protein BFL35_02255 [Clavibacter michiganensis]|nr:hypothetical protein BFL35_02255 [Clavibacter michiganensis]